MNNSTHPLQSHEWGEFREKTGVKTIRGSDFQLTIHTLPYSSFTIGYVPKGIMPTEKMLKELVKIGKDNGCIFIKLEPNVERKYAAGSMQHAEWVIDKYRLHRSPHPLFTQYTFQLDLTKSEDELLKQMSAKTRYNVRLAQKKGVVVEEDNSDQAFEEYLRLTFETTERQGFYAHDEKYHRLMWKTLGSKTGGSRPAPTHIAHLLTAKFQGKILVAWIVFLYDNVLYYPYGASSSEHREVMASNLMMWEAMKWGRDHGAKLFDLWGALGPNPDPNDPWFGFHRFKEGYGPRHVEFIGSWDLVLHPMMYRIYNVLHSVRWTFLKLKK